MSLIEAVRDGRFHKMYFAHYMMQQLEFFDVLILISYQNIRADLFSFYFEYYIVLLNLSAAAYSFFLYIITIRMSITFTHLVLSGGGLSGLLYLGSLRYLQQEKYDVQIKHIAGTSIGAFFGTAFGLGISISSNRHNTPNGLFPLTIISLRLSVAFITPA
mgnify:CR=1 FL=1